MSKYFEVRAVKGYDKSDRLQEQSAVLSLIDGSEGLHRSPLLLDAQLSFIAQVSECPMHLFKLKRFD